MNSLRLAVHVYTRSQAPPSAFLVERPHVPPRGDPRWATGKGVALAGRLGASPSSALAADRLLLHVWGSVPSSVKWV